MNEKKLTIIELPHGRMLLSLYDTKCPIYVCPVRIAENNKLLKVHAFRVISN